jgi:amino acid adenylation domain-containing protein
VPAAFPPPEPDAPAYVLYTSGSTGRPKGVVVSQANLWASTAAREEVYATPPGRFLLIPSVAFDSSVAGIFWTLASAGTLVIPTDEEARDPQRLAGLVAEEEVTTLLCVPSLYAAMLRSGGVQMGGLEAAIVAGESCSRQVVREHFAALPRTRLFNEYGPTEATVWATVQELTAVDAERRVGIGRPIPAVRLHLRDRRGRRVPAGIPGLAWISGPTVAQGYWGREELTSERFVGAQGADGLALRRYRSGDLMRWTPEGNLLFLGREDDQIKLRGFRIEPGEIEAALLARPGVKEAAVVLRAVGARPGSGAGAGAPQHLVAFIVPRDPQRNHPGDGATLGDGLNEQLAELLPDFMVPRRYVELPHLPRLPNGKTDRNRLRDMVLPEDSSARSSDLPENDHERAVLALWEGLLGRTGFGVRDNFFELGGHSLLVIEMAHAIERDHGVAITGAEVFQHPTVRGVAGLMQRRDVGAATKYAHLFPLQPGGAGAPFIVCVPHVFSEMLANRFRGERPVYGLRGVSLRAEGNRGRWRTMRELAAELVDEIQLRFSGEACVMAGYSFGASMAFEAVRVMEERGIPVRSLYMIAPMPLDRYRLGPMRAQIVGARKPVDELTVGEAAGLIARENNPFTLRPYRRAWRLLAVQGWRRLLCAGGWARRRLGMPLTPGIMHADVRLERFRLHGKYRPGTIRTPTVIFNPREPETDAAATWRPSFRGPLVVCDTPDPHLGEASIEAAEKLILDHLADGEAS